MKTLSKNQIKHVKLFEIKYLLSSFVLDSFMWKTVIICLEANDMKNTNPNY